ADATMRMEMRFSSLRDETGLSDATLSKQLNTLEEAGLVSRFREYGSRRMPRCAWRCAFPRCVMRRGFPTPRCPSS
ncbi:helix-turn-helix transcriptional regulator, partial [Bacteroides fragilis]|nr:helix-turn-helix transcriptional regulator [Bacteroides fragilis]